MLTVTEAAAAAIAGLSTRVGDAGEGGLRVASTAESPEELAVSVAREPVAGDRVVVADGGAQVYLDATASNLLDDKVLDVREREGGGLDFVIAAQD